MIGEKRSSVWSFPDPSRRQGWYLCYYTMNTAASSDPQAGKGAIGPLYPQYMVAEPHISFSAEIRKRKKHKNIILSKINIIPLSTSQNHDNFDLGIYF